MIISRKHARRLLKAGKAQIETGVKEENRYYVAISRFDNQRTDHFEADREDHLRLCNEFPLDWSREED
jgi:hypothetical protein